MVRGFDCNGVDQPAVDDLHPPGQTAAPRSYLGCPGENLCIFPSLIPRVQPKIWTQDIPRREGSRCVFSETRWDRTLADNREAGAVNARQGKGGNRWPRLQSQANSNESSSGG